MDEDLSDPAVVGLVTRDRFYSRCSRCDKSVKREVAAWVETTMYRLNVRGTS